MGESVEEWFDVVDASDCVLRRETRGAVHRNGWLHRAVHLFVFNQRGELFLQKRSLFKDTDPGKWSTSCAGHVDAGEDYDAALMREAAEELGLHLKAIPERVCYIRAVPETGNEFLWVYQTVAEGPFVLPPDEILEGRWWPLEVLKHRSAEEPDAFAASFLYVWSQIEPTAPSSSR